MEKFASKLEGSFNSIVHKLSDLKNSAVLPTFATASLKTAQRLIAEQVQLIL